VAGEKSSPSTAPSPLRARTLCPAQLGPLPGPGSHLLAINCFSKEREERAERRERREIVLYFLLNFCYNPTTTSKVSIIQHRFVLWKRRETGKREKSNAAKERERERERERSDFGRASR
jgi:hypothetical protein